MVSDPEKERIKKNSFVVERDGGVLYTYANNVNLDWTAHDIRFRFAEVTVMPDYRPDRAQFRIEERASIAVSWSEAKTIFELLGKVLQEYETLNGPIQPPTAPQSVPE